MHKLSPDEAKLWARVTATIRPLSRDRQDKPAPAPVAPNRGPSPPSKGGIPPARPEKSYPNRTKILHQGTLDGSWDRRLSSGKVVPDRTLDLHGHNLDRAWQAIDQGLERAIVAGDRVLLLITGHQRQGEPPLERGRIRAAVNDWLAASRHASRIAAVRGAHRSHGGGGSLYIILRRGP